MSKNGLDDIIKKLERIQKNLAEEIAPDVNELLKDSVRFSLIDWYNDYTPNSYERTYNFMKVLNNTKTRAKGNTLIMSVDSGSMNNYVGFYGNKLQPSVAFEFFFMGGEHGHGKWMKHQSIPPYMYIDADISSGFGGQIDNIIEQAIDRILK